MFRRFGRTCLPRLLFWVTWVTSVSLIGLVFLAPLLDNGAQGPRGWSRVVAVFARDGTMRRTSVAGAVGLAVTACVFFRRPGWRRAPRKPPRLPPPPANVVGA